MEHGQKEKAFRERRLAKACDYVTDLWLPVNSAHLEKIKRGIEAENYDKGLNFLIDDLKQDPPLFLYCVRELVKLLRENGEIAGIKSPIELFEEAGLETLKEILRVETNTISKHSVSGFSSLQVGRVQEMLTSASTTEVLCEASSTDPDLGFSVAIFRQMGLALVAWNYPNVYQQAIREITPTRTLEEVLAKHLGFSPSALALRLARAWGIPEPIIETFSLHDDSAEDEAESRALEADERQITEAISDSVANLCRIGEALARANNPEIYPRARDEWNEARNAIEQRLGKNGLQAIRKRFQNYSVAYLDFAPGIFKPGMVLDPEARITAMERIEGLCARLPRCFEQCSPVVQSKVRELYQIIEMQHDIQVSLAFWKSQLIPVSGFSGGHVFSAEPALQSLLAHLTFGTPMIHAGGSVPMNHTSEIIGVAFKNPVPIIREYLGPANALFSAIAGSIGFSQRVGVLYVELPREEYLAHAEQHLINFRSFAQALNDCLKLK